MAPTTELLSVRITEDVKAALELIVEGADYFTTFREVAIHQGGPWDQKLFPSITLLPLTESQGGELVNAETLKLGYLAIAVFENPVDTTSAFRLLKHAEHDIHKAIMADRQRGGLALSTEWLSATPAIDPDEERTLVWVECRFDVTFRTSTTDMTQQV